MHTAAEIRDAIRKKRQEGQRQRALQQKLGGASKQNEHVTNRDFDLTAPKSRKGGA